MLSPGQRLIQKLHGEVHVHGNEEGRQHKKGDRHYLEVMLPGMVARLERPEDILVQTPRPLPDINRYIVIS